MKKTTTLLLCTLALLWNITSAQTYHELTTDPADAPGFAPDLKGLEYALDTLQDSLWLRLTYFDDIDGDFGSAIGLDTNGNLLDGQTWGGANTSMKPDEIIYLERNGFFETEIRVSSALVRSLKEVDSVTVVLNFAFSEVAPSRTLRLIAGTGSFDIATSKTVYDDAPDTGYVTLPKTVSTGIAESENGSQLVVFPNPAQTHIYPKTTQNSTAGTYRIVALDGKILRQFSAANTQRIDVSDLNQGMYLLMYENESGNQEFSRFQVIHY